MTSEVAFLWIDRVDALKDASADIIDMMNASVKDDGMLGYGNSLSANEIRGFLSSWEWQLSNGTAHIIIARDDVGPCGMAFMRTHGNSNYRHIADLSKGYVVPRRRGTSTLVSMFMHCCRRARSMGVELFTLDTREGSRALAIWKHFGFKTHGVLPDYSRFGGQSHAGHFMHQEIANLVQLLEKRESHAAR